MSLGLGNCEEKVPEQHVNLLEIQLIADLIKYLLTNGVPGSCVVVVASCYAQVKEIQKELRNIK